MKKTALVLMLITIFSKIFGFLRELALSYFYGASGISDAYIISLTIPNVIFMFIGTAITAGFIPSFANIEKDKGTDEANIFVSNLITLVMLACTILIVIGNIFAPELVKIFASGFEGETLEYAIRFTRIGLFSIYFLSLVYIYTPFLQSKESFYGPALIGFPLNIITVLIIYFSKKIDVEILAYGSLLSALGQAAFLYPFARKRGYRYRFHLDLHDPEIQSMAVMALPMIIGSSINQINVLVDRTVASGIAEGGISALNYGNLLNMLMYSVFIMPLVSIMYPSISKFVANKDFSSMKNSVSEILIVACLIVLPATFGIMIFSQETVSIAYGRGAFDQQAVLNTSGALFFYSLGLLGISFREVLSRVFYSVKDSKTPMINAAVGLIINIVLNLTLSKIIGIPGLALATSISAIVTSTLMFISVRRRFGAFGFRHLVISGGKIFLASIFMALGAYFANMALVPVLGQNISLILSIGLAAIIYGIIIYFMKIKEVDEFIGIVKKRIGRA